MTKMDMSTFSLMQVLSGEYKHSCYQTLVLYRIIIYMNYYSTIIDA